MKDIEKRDGKVYIDLDDDSAITLKVDKEGKILESTGAHIQSGEYNGKNLSDLVGKEVAVKVMQSEDGVLRGDDLRIGGEGMKGFYDDILPRFMNKYGKKWGVKVEDITLPALGEDAAAGIAKGLTMHSVPVTEEMKESVMQGQTMFRVAMEEYDKESKELFDAAKERFGTTRDLREAGYVLPDGSMLDFSGRHQASGDTSYLNGERTVDHRDIEDLNFERDLNTPSGRNTSMPDFIERGAIRIHMPGMINLAVKPTPEQASVLERLINADNHYVTVDFGNGYSTEHSAEYDNARPVRIINDINRYFDEGYTPRGNTMFRITPEQDAEYMEAVNAGDMDKAQQMVKDAAKAAGYNSPKLYHGSDAFGFTRIDTSMSDDRASFWATNKENVAGSYTKLSVTRKPGSEISDEEYEKAVEVADNALDEEIQNFRSLIDKYFSEWFFGDGGNDGIRHEIMGANHIPGYGDGVYDVLEDYVAEAFRDYGEDHEEEYEDFADWEENSQEAQEIFDSISSLEGLRNQLWEIENGDLTGGIYELYANTDNMFVVDAGGNAWNNIHPEGLPKIERDQYKNVPYRTRDVVKWAKENGYDGVIFKNIRDNGQYGRTEPSDVYAFLDPQAQVKSADPVTYDDQGNIIPLSERFNEGNDDIRFRLAPMGEA